MGLLKGKIKFGIKLIVLILLFQLLLHGCKCGGGGGSSGNDRRVTEKPKEEPKPEAFFLTTDKTYRVGKQPVSVIAADLNNDSKQDVISANRISGNISVLMGNGDGTLKAAQHYNVAISQEDVKSADLNNDGNQDIVVAHGNETETDGISILLGNGNGSLQTPVTYPAGGAPNKIVVADFNFDGDRDLAAGSFSGNVKVFMGNGDGTIGEADEVFAGFSPVSLASGDMNGDELIDLIAGNVISGGETVWVLLNIFSVFSSVSSLAFDGGSSITDIKVSDLNSDGHLDVIAARERVTILLGLGGGELGDPHGFSTDYSGNSATRIEVTDITGDGNTDIITNSNTMTILPGRGDGTFKAPIWVDTGVNESPSDIAIADMNNDGKLDVVSCYAVSNSIKVFLTP